MSLRTRTIEKIDDSIVPLTPAATPSRANYPGSSFTPINLETPTKKPAQQEWSFTPVQTPQTPTKFRRLPRDALSLTPMATAERSSKRGYDDIRGNNDDEAMDTETITPSKRPRTANSGSRYKDGGKVSTVTSALQNLPLPTTPPPTLKRKYVHVQHANSNDDETEDNEHIVPYIKRPRTIRSSSSSSSTSSSSSSSSDCSDYSPSPPPSKNLNPTSNSLTGWKTFNIPLTSLGNRPTSSKKPPVLSAFEAKRVKASILEQIDWEKVAEDVACNRGARVYRRAVVGMLEGWVRGVERGEGRGE